MNVPDFSFFKYYCTSNDYRKLLASRNHHVFECCIPLDSGASMFRRNIWGYIDHTGLISDENLDGERISINNTHSIGIRSRTVTIRGIKYYMPAYESTLVSGARFEKQLGILMPHLSCTELMDQMDRLMLVYKL